MRLPSSPYPGLRPFLDHEAALLFGREGQTAEVIERLRQTKFVTVLGGSGSGKSSLIRAGVIPELRSFGIPEAGDFWIPIVCTPGTNFDPALGHTPITRLARRLDTALKPRGSAAANSDRINEIASVFRQEAGFDRLVEAYTKELTVPSGTDATQARLLFVIDQFEELFHTTNKNSEDARLLVERVIDHFFNPHTRCYVILTMRSEHLNDCPAYLELPDAINKSFYLVRRLDDEQLREAIVGPAQRYLRLLKRQARDNNYLPDEIEFEPEVLKRILVNVQEITDNPDHLPLLQHLLARLWQVSSERQKVTDKVPRTITWNDLERAVSGSSLLTGPTLSPAKPTPNVVSTSLENWAEAVYLEHSVPERQQIEAVLQQLGFKDPNNGMYTQQRVNISDCTRQLGDGTTPETLRALLDHGYIGSVNYLFWDDENSGIPTIKVSHESFIRGWSRFRRIIDKEGERFEEFLTLLRKCLNWSSAGRPGNLLLEAADLLRLRYANLETVITNKAERDDWVRVLLQYREGEGLSQAAPVIPDFLATSKQRQKKAETDAIFHKILKWALPVAGLAFLGLLIFYREIQAPAMKASELFFTAFTKAVGAPFSESSPMVGSAIDVLGSLTDAADGFEKGTFIQFSVEKLGWLPPIRERVTYLNNFSRPTESVINGVLYRLMTNTLWLGNANLDPDKAIATPKELINVSCSPDSDLKKSGTKEIWTGHIYIKEGEPRRVLFLPRKVDSRSDEIPLYSANYDEQKSPKCTVGKILFSIPKKFQPKILLESSMQHLLVSTLYAGVKRTGVYSLAWDRLEMDEGWKPRAVVTGEVAHDKVQKDSAGGRLNLATTWSSLGGVTIKVSDQYWRIISDQAEKLETSKDEAWSMLTRASDESPCLMMKTNLDRDRTQISFKKTMYENEAYCFQVKRGNPESNSPTKFEMVFANIYSKPAPDELRQSEVQQKPSTLPVASLNFGYQSETDDKWYLGTATGPYEGWISLKTKSQSHFGAPWSTKALKELAENVSNQ